MPKSDVIELEGEVIDITRSDIKVKLSNGHVITAYVSGKLKQNFIKVIIGDKVRCELSPYDLTKGRITYRLKKEGN